MKTLFTLLLCVIAGIGYSQQTFTISGQILDINGNPVKFASVQVVITNSGAGTPLDGYSSWNNSDLNGNYTVAIPNGSDPAYNYSYLILVHQCMGSDSALVSTQNGTINQVTQNFSSNCANGSCSISFTAAPQTSDTIYLTATISNPGAPGIAVGWNFGDGTGTAGLYPTHVYSSNGSYEVCAYIYDSLSTCYTEFCDTITDAFKAPGFVLKVLPAQSVSIDENQVSDFSLFPNPANNVLYIGNNDYDALYSVRVYDITGKMVIEKMNQSGNATLNISDTKPGIYFVQVRDADGVTISNDKFIKH